MVKQKLLMGVERWPMWVNFLAHIASGRHCWSAANTNTDETHVRRSDLNPLQLEKGQHHSEKRC